jgi:tight adherence protein B
MPIFPVFIFGIGLLGFLVLIYFAFAGPNVQKIQAKRLDEMRQRHASAGSLVTAEAQMKRILARSDNQLDSIAGRFLPRPDRLRQRLSQTGKSSASSSFYSYRCIHWPEHSAYGHRIPDQATGQQVHCSLS